MTITEARAHIGGGVVYKSGTDAAEEGVITQVGHVWVFVRYGEDDCRQVTGSARAWPTRPEDLTLLPG